jgi:Na+-driven multidrug efflux pump
MSQNKPGIIAKSLGVSTILNIILNYILITSLLPYGQIYSVYGAAISTIISQGIYLGILVLSKK